MLDRLVTRIWSEATVSDRRSTVAIVLYFAAGLCGALLAVSGDGGMRRVVWGLFAVVLIVLGVTLAVYRSRRV